MAVSFIVLCSLIYSDSPSVSILCSIGIVERSLSCLKILGDIGIECEIT